MPLALCVDFGSTFTKALLVDVDDGALVGAASHRTTIGTDLLEALDAIREQLAREHPGARDAEVRACSSAAGGLRIAVVGNEELVTSEAGHRVALSSGGWVVHVASDVLDDVAVDALARTAPDLLLLVGGTDGGNAKVLLANARTLAAAGLGLPIVVAGNGDCRDEIGELFERAGTRCVLTENVLPDIGVVRPEPARAAIREAFLRHVIGGKRLSRRAEFTDLVRGPTPDIVLRGVELLADKTERDVVVVDVGGATTDVHSVVRRTEERQPDVAGVLPVSRTVEGDLGLRWNAVGVVEASDRSLVEVDRVRLHDAARRRVEDPGFVSSTPDDLEADERLATLAITTALRRHAGRSQVVPTPSGRTVERSGKDLTTVGLLIGSGGLFRHVEAEVGDRILRAALADPTGAGWLVPERPVFSVDRHYVLAAAGLLVDDNPSAASNLLASLAIRPADRPAG